MKIFVLNRKYVYMFICFLVISIAIYVSDMDLKKAVMTNTTPITNKVVVLDAGHRSSGSGNCWE